MTLYKQIVSLITLFLVFMISIVLWFILNYNKTLIEEQMSSNAKNSANFLGLSISKNVDFDDKATIEGMLSAVIDNGFYEYIIVRDLDGKTVVESTSPRELENSPKWFSSIFSINAPTSSANIVKEWINLGVIEVKIHQDFANNQMWKTFVATSQIFILGVLVLLIFIYVFLNKLLQPLEKLSVQAKAIDNNEFIIEENLPNTIEFKNVVVAMNKTMRKMQSIFNKEVDTLNKYNNLLYKDEDTKLGNKNYFLLKLNTYLKNSHGLTVFLELKDEISFKKTVGFKNYMSFTNFIIDKINEKFSSNSDLVFSKFNDGTFAILLPNRHYEDIQEDLNDIYENISSYLEANEIKELYNLKYAFGVSNYEQNSIVKDILSKTDQSLSIAMNKKDRRIDYEENVRFTKQEWIELLEWAMNNDGIKFISQNILNTKDENFKMQEYFLRLEDKNKEVYSPGDFLSIVFALGWMPKFEKHVFNKIFKEHANDKDENSAVINVSADFVKDRENITWLTKILKKEFFNSKTIFYFECVNADILNNFEEFSYFAKELAKTQHKIAIESFTFDNENLDYIKTIKPAYLKISKSYLVGVDGPVVGDSVLLNITSTIGAYLVVKHVETKEEYDELVSMKIEYLQGKYIDTLKVK